LTKGKANFDALKNYSMLHTFHIPVLGLAFSVDTPIKVAPLGISSVTSIVDDFLLERMRKYYSESMDYMFTPINTLVPDYRTKRITAYLNTMERIVQEKVAAMKRERLADQGELNRYYHLLPEQSPLKQTFLRYLAMEEGAAKKAVEDHLRNAVRPGSIDVNIMAKVDKLNKRADGEEDLSDALAALKGYAESELHSNLILSAGMNPRLYAYLEEFPDFFVNTAGEVRKKIVLKVSDYRSALIQAKFLAKKALWVQEFRIESGLNCGGHAFATEGHLLGPVLEEFKEKRTEMHKELESIYLAACLDKSLPTHTPPLQKITVQGGIGTAEENRFLLEHYALDGTGWGSPFLLVPEATTVDRATLDALTASHPEDYYLSGSSPLGIPFNNFRHSGMEKLRLARIAKGRPGSPCVKKFLVSNTEFTAEPICTASREYQNLKIKEIEARTLYSPEEINAVTEKACLCDGLATAAYLKYDLLKPRESSAVAICPGPNLAYFSRTYGLEEMVQHIYGEVDLLEGIERPHMFINELRLYVNYLRKELEDKNLDDKKRKSLVKFRAQLCTGINYYRNLTHTFKIDDLQELSALEAEVLQLLP
jgi:hypothetical protein